MSAAVEWLVSPWDERTHAFDDRQAVTARAVCSHSAPTGRLVEPTEDNPKCLICLVAHGLELRGAPRPGGWQGRGVVPVRRGRAAPGELRAARLRLPVRG